MTVINYSLVLECFFYEYFVQDINAQPCTTGATQFGQVVLGDCEAISPTTGAGYQAFTIVETVAVGIYQVTTYLDTSCNLTSMDYLYNATQCLTLDTTLDTAYRLAGQIAECSPTPAPTPPPSPTAPPPTPIINRISPIFECWLPAQFNSSSPTNRTCFFGYNNPNPFNVFQPVGPNNRLIPNTFNNRLPTDFLTGRQRLVFNATAPGDNNLVWFLSIGGSRTATCGTRLDQRCDATLAAFTTTYYNSANCVNATQFSNNGYFRDLNCTTTSQGNSLIAIYDQVLYYVNSTGCNNTSPLEFNYGDCQNITNNFSISIDIL